MKKEALIMDIKGKILTAEEELAILKRALKEDTVEAYMDAYFVEEFGSGEEFFKSIEEESGDQDGNS